MPSSRNIIACSLFFLQLLLTTFRPDDGTCLVHVGQLARMLRALSADTAIHPEMQTRKSSRASSIAENAAEILTDSKPEEDIESADPTEESEAGAPEKTDSQTVGFIRPLKAV